MVKNEDRDLLISKWFPIIEVSVESVRESSTGHNPPTSRIHVWFARRPHATSRAAVLESLLPSNARREDVLRLLGIPLGVDVRKAEEEIAKAKAVGKRFNYNPFSWEKSFKHTPSEAELSRLYAVLKEFWGVERPLVVDPMAGGGSIPFEAMRLGLPVVAGDLNPVAFVCLKGTLEYPARFGKKLLPAVESFCKEIHEAATAELEEFFPQEKNEVIYRYFWTRTIHCPSCGLSVPLSPNWWLANEKEDNNDIAVRLLVREKDERCSFEIIKGPKRNTLDPERGTVKGGKADCPRCHTVIDGN